MQQKNEKTTQNSNEVKKLYRSKVDRIFAGVCAGIAEYFNIDVTIVRVITLILFFFKGIGIFFYLICLITMKENPQQSAADRKQSQNTAIYWGIGLVLLGLSLLPHWRWNYWSVNIFCWHLFDPWLFDWDIFWPTVIILFGVLYLVHVLRQDKEGSVDEKTTDKFFRSRRDKVIGGVCGGIAENMKIDPVIVRIGWIVLSLATKFILGIIVYILCMIIFSEQPIKPAAGPEKPVATPPTPKTTPKRVKKISKQPPKEDNK